MEVSNLKKELLEAFTKDTLKKLGLPNTPASYVELGAKFFVTALQNSNVDQFSIAKYCYRIAADAGYAEGQAALGSTCMHDLDGEKDFKQAEYWARKAADQGNLNGMYGLGTCYCINGDYKNAEYWLQKAADGGHPQAAETLETIKILSNLGN